MYAEGEADRSHAHHSATALALVERPFDRSHSIASQATQAGAPVCSAGLEALDVQYQPSWQRSEFGYRDTHILRDLRCYSETSSPTMLIRERKLLPGAGYIDLAHSSGGQIMPDSTSLAPQERVPLCNNTKL